MELKEGTTVKNTHGEKVGNIDQIVFDPASQQVTHIMVKKGFFFPEDKVIPLEQIQASDDNSVVLHITDANLDDFPTFEYTRYISSDGEYDYRGAGSFSAVRPLLYYPPLQPDHYPYYRTVAEPATQVVERNVPADTVVLSKGTKVTSQNGEHVGNIEEVFANADGKISHLLISKGLLFPTERLIPMNWLDTASDTEVRLRVPVEVVERVPNHQ